MEMIELDGAAGEGGGQILRSALTLSMVTGKPFRIDRIRARRAKPGLMRQHLTAVLAAAEICGARLEGAAVGSQSLGFVPDRIRAGDYRFAIGTAGSCTLVLQTVLPALWMADAPSMVIVQGGTHNPYAPPADFLIESWLPVLRAMGVEMDIELVRHGFYPAGGGEVRVRLNPVRQWTRLDLIDRGEHRGTHAVAIVAGVPVDVAHRELACVEKHLGGIHAEVRQLTHGEGPGNALVLTRRYAGVSACFTGFGARGVSGESIAESVALACIRFHSSGAAVESHLADQLVLPSVLAGGGCFSTNEVSSHLRSNLETLKAFIPADIGIDESQEEARVEIRI